VRYVLRAQRDRFWPLKVIKANLDAIDRGLTPADGGDGHPRAPVPTPDPDVPDAGQLATRAELRLTAAELARATGLAPGEVADLVAHGLLRPDPRGMHDDADLQVASAAAGLSAYGVEPRHLRSFRAAADREVGLVEQVVGPRRGADAQRHAAEVAHLCLALDVLGVRVEMPTNQPIVLLRERDGDRYLPIWIGAAEATAIAYAQQGVVPPRPLTHDLLRNVIDELGHELTRVRIVALKDGVFHAMLDLDGGAAAGGTDIESRSSDAIALALRAGAEIVAEEELLDEAGVEMAETEDDEVEKFKEFLDHVSADDFDTEADTDS